MYSQEKAKAGWHSPLPHFCNGHACSEPTNKSTIEEYFAFLEVIFSREDNLFSDVTYLTYSLISPLLPAFDKAGRNIRLDKSHGPKLAKFFEDVAFEKFPEVLLSKVNLSLNKRQDGNRRINHRRRRDPECQPIHASARQTSASKDRHADPCHNVCDLQS